jgi:hypothetical protein
VLSSNCYIDTHPMRNFMKKILFALAVLGVPMGMAHADPISIASFGSAYTQDFDRLGTATYTVTGTAPVPAGTGTNPTPAVAGNYLSSSNGTSAAALQGFQFAEQGTGGAVNGTYILGTGSSSTGNSYNFGVTNAATDRAYGVLNSGAIGGVSGANLADPQTTFGLVFKNDTGSNIDSLSISYRGEQYRYGGATGNRDRIDFQIKTTGNPTSILGTGFTNIDALDFASPGSRTTIGALDGNLPENSQFLSNTYSPTGGIAAGSTFVIRFNPVFQAGANDGLAIDDFSLTANARVVPTPEPSTFALFAIGMVGFGIVVRRRKTADAQAKSGATVGAALCC